MPLRHESLLVEGERSCPDRVPTAYVWIFIHPMTIRECLEEDHASKRLLVGPGHSQIHVRTGFDARTAKPHLLNRLCPSAGSLEHASCVSAYRCL